MNKNTTFESTISDIHAAMHRGELTSAELVEQYLDRIESYDRNGPELNSIVTVNPTAIDRAKELDKTLDDEGLTGPLHGIPVLVKDQAETADIPTSFGSEAFADYHPKNDAHLVSLIKSAGGIILAKTNLPDWAASWFGYSSVLGETKNPYALERDPGGSSAGTAAGIAANLGTVGIGEDTGGSIRVPASCCNLFGIRVTTGLISRTGLSPLIERQDTAGPIARTVTDMATLLDVIVGYDPADVRTSNVRQQGTDSYLDYLNPTALEGARIGILREAFGEEDDPNAAPVNEVIEDSLSTIESTGAELIDPVTIPDLDSLLEKTSLYISQSRHDLNEFFSDRDVPMDSVEKIYEAGAYHDKLDLFEQIASGPKDLGEDPDYWESVVAQETLRTHILNVFESHSLDAIAFPDVQVIPPTREWLQSGIDTAAYPTNTVIASQSSCPAVSMPAGFTDNGLPVGIEFLATPYEERQLIELAYAYEQAAQPRKPPENTPEL